MAETTHESSTIQDAPPRRLQLPTALTGKMIDKMREAGRTETQAGVTFEWHDDSQVVTAWDGLVRVVTHADVSGLSHYSTGGVIERLNPAIKNRQKFGLGVYFGAGELAGETIDLIKTQGAQGHEAELHDVTVLVMSRDDLGRVRDESRKAAGETIKLKSNMSSDVGLSDRLGGLDFGVGAPVDAVMIQMDEASAEVILLPHAYDKADLTATGQLHT